MNEKARELMLSAIKIAEAGYLNKDDALFIEETKKSLLKNQPLTQARMALGHDGHIFSAKPEDEWMVQHYIDI